LTRRLAPRVAHLTAVEIDRDLAAALRPELPANVDLIAGDILDIDLSRFVADGAVRVAGNLPYNISSPILFKLLAVNATRAEAPWPHGNLPLVDATLMLQREVADRLAAKPGTRDYGVLTIFTAAQADVRPLLSLPPGAFRPAPRVHSAVVHLTFKPPVVPEPLRETFGGMVRTMFTQRRKTILNALRPFAEPRGHRSAVALAEAGIETRRRPETLDLAELLRLAYALSREP
jgi:16S rRNA (adenine1518-N6/adenine1519-N6)-dimethyltransferase